MSLSADVQLLLQILEGKDKEQLLTKVEAHLLALREKIPADIREEHDTWKAFEEALKQDILFAAYSETVPASTDPAPVEPTQPEESTTEVETPTEEQVDAQPEQQVDPNANPFVG